MVLQLDYCTVILKSLHNSIDFIFLFDHSCGHYRGIKNGLNATNMKNSYSGAKLDMQPTNIKQEVGYLVLYE